MVIQIENLQKRLSIKPKQIHNIIEAVLKKEKVVEAQLNVVIATAQKIRVYNRRFKNRDYATDVIAFDLTEDVFLGKIQKPRQSHLVGDIIVSSDAAIQNAKIYKTSPHYELILYIIHGILHLLGFNDHAPREIKRMRVKEEEVMEYISANLESGMW